jgi:hypothetical protein
MHIELEIVTDKKDVENSFYIEFVDKPSEENNILGSAKLGKTYINRIEIALAYETKTGILRPHNINTLARTFAHELGHTGGLYHPHSKNAHFYTKMMYFFGKLDNNIMNQSKVSNGQSINFFQFEYIDETINDNNIMIFNSTNTNEKNIYNHKDEAYNPDDL